VAQRGGDSEGWTKVSYRRRKAIRPGDRGQDRPRVSSRHVGFRGGRQCSSDRRRTTSFSRDSHEIEGLGFSHRNHNFSQHGFDHSGCYCDYPHRYPTRPEQHLVSLARYVNNNYQHSRKQASTREHKHTPREHSTAMHMDSYEQHRFEQSHGRSRTRRHIHSPSSSASIAVSYQGNCNAIFLLKR